MRLKAKLGGAPGPVQAELSKLKRLPRETLINVSQRTIEKLIRKCKARLMQDFQNICQQVDGRPVMMRLMEKAKSLGAATQAIEAIEQDTEKVTLTASKRDLMPRTRTPQISSVVCVLPG